ncbi:MAG: Ig-like domain-containing protein, partial [Eubacterium sp.]
MYGKQGAQGTAVLTATYEGSEGSINVNVQPKAEVSAKVQALAATLPQDSKDFKVKDIATYREFLGWYMSFKSNEVKSLNLPDFIKDQRSDYCLALANMINPYDGIDGFLRAEQGVEKIAQTVAIYPEAIKTQLNALQTKIADYKTQTTGDTMNQAELETAKDAIQGDSVAIVSAILKTLPSVDTADVAHEEQFLTAKVAYNALTSDDYRSKVDVDAVKNMKDGIAKIEAIKATVHADSVVLDKTEIGFRKTETTQLTATVLPEKTTDKTVIWSSENSAIATVSDKGLVTGIENGTTTITAQTENGKKATCIVSVIGDLAPVESVNINQTEATLKVGHDVTLTATIKPSNAVIKAATWTSSNAEIATVNSETGRVIAQKEGVTTITATADNKTATCQVTVTPRPQKEEATVYFKYDDGRIQDMDADKTFTLTMSDGGNFVLEGSDKTPWWQCIEEYKDGETVTKRDIWIAAGSGAYNPYSAKTMDATVVDEATCENNNPSVLANFKIKTVHAEIEALQLFVNDKAVEDTLTVQGSEVQMLTVKARLKGQTNFEFIPNRAIYITKNNGDVTMGTGSAVGRFSFTKPGTVDLSVVSKDNGMSKNLKVTSEYVKVEKIISPEPARIFEIDSWNALGGYYVGMTEPAFTVLPENASDKSVTWTEHTPDIAINMVDMFANGLVPKKNGLARFTVTSNDDKTINHTFEIDYRYKNPVKSVSIDQKEINAPFNDTVNLSLNFSPTNATEQRFDWTYDQNGIVEIKDQVVTKPSDSVGRETVHTMRTLKEGTVTVTGTPWDTSSGAQAISFKVNVSKGGSGQIADVKKMTKDGIASGQQFVNTVDNNAYGAEWNIFAMARSGGDVGKGNVEAWYDDVVSKTQAGTYFSNPTDIARVALAINASGRDAMNVGGINLIEKLYNYPNLSNATSNAMAFALITMDSKNYTLPSDAACSREKMIDELLLYQKDNGGFGLNKEGQTVSIDMTAMILQSLSTYNDDTHPKVKAAAEKGLTYLKNNMTGECGFIDSGSENSNSTAQVLTALTSLKIDPTKEENGFTRSNKNIITNLDSYKVTTGGFKYKSTDPNTKANGMATQQVLYALESYQRLMDGTNKLYDLTDVGSVTPPPVENPDQKAAQVVIDQINALGEITYAKKEAVEAARAAYDALNDKQKTWVTADTLKVLADAETKIKELTPETRTITVSVERFTIGQGYFKEPIKVAFHEGESGMDIFKRIVGEENVEYSNGYFSAIKGANLGTDQVQIPDYIVQALGGPDTDAAKLEDNAKYENKTTLGQGSYTDQSGWLYFTNNTSPSVGMDAYQPKQDDVMRVQFSYWGWGADLTGLVYGDSEPKVAIANKDTLTKALAEVNSAINKEALLADETVQIAYAQAKEIATNMTADQATTDETAKALNDAVSGFGKAPSVYFEYEDGRIQEMDKDQSFTLTMSDVGKFVLKNSEATPYWKCIDDHGDSKDIWIAAYSGIYNPYSVNKTMDAVVIDDATAYDEKPTILARFKIKAVPAEIENLKLFVNDKEVGDDLTIQGSEVQMLTV